MWVPTKSSWLSDAKGNIWLGILPTMDWATWQYLSSDGQAFSFGGAWHSCSCKSVPLIASWWHHQWQNPIHANGIWSIQSELGKRGHLEGWVLSTHDKKGKGRWIRESCIPHQSLGTDFQKTNGLLKLLLKVLLAYSILFERKLHKMEFVHLVTFVHMLEAVVFNQNIFVRYAFLAMGTVSSQQRGQSTGSCCRRFWLPERHFPSKHGRCS